MRPKALGDPQKLAMARTLYADKTNTIDDICRALGVRRSTLYRYVRTELRTTQQLATGASAGRP